MPESVEQVQRAFTAYTIERELGSGGMATVYLAHDKKHDRKVAIKILHAELAAVLGAERFLQEIKLTANLQHPHILGLIDSGIIGDAAGELRGRPYYVMPFVEGESLRQRLDKEQQLPVSDSVRIATEVASALDYAHRHGVIHRDIKPENILLHDGSAIVADFGIALAVTEAGGARITQTGLSLGTPGYMSPEQAMGERTITARSDIYSLGAVTYEMLAGEPPFTGPTVQAVVARVMTEEPRPLTAQRRSVPPHVSAAVSHALEKVPADRFASAHEFADALNNPSGAVSFAAPAMVHGATMPRDRALLYGLAAVATLFLATTLWGWTRKTAPAQVVRYALAFDSTEMLTAGGDYYTRFAISPDGSMLAYFGGPHGQLLLRRRNELHATGVPGTEPCITPFFSPDSKSVGCLGPELLIASVSGGPPIAVTRVTGVAGASWGSDGFIYADAQGGTFGGGLFRMPAKRAATAEPFTVLDSTKSEIDHVWPDVLPNGKAVLFTVVLGTRQGESTGYAIAVAEIPSGKHRILLQDAMHAVYVSSGYLLYATADRVLMAVPFDEKSLRITGDATPVADSIRVFGWGVADIAVSRSGTLVYATGAGGEKEQLVWVTRDGKSQVVDSTWVGGFQDPAISPDGKQLAVAARNDQGIYDVWIKQLDRGPAVRLTSGQRALEPAWSADGQSVTFSTIMGGGGNWLVTKRADGTGDAESPGFREKRELFAPVWSRDGKWLVFYTGRDGAGGPDILGFRPGVDKAPTSLVATRFSEAFPALSPDGRWLAYMSDESGRFEIYVVPFPNTGAGKWAVSTEGGRYPKWARSGKELFYSQFRPDGTGDIVAVPVSTSPVFSAGRPAVVLRSALSGSSTATSEFDVAPDGRRFLVMHKVAAETPDKLIFVDNWFEELKSKSRK
jgi:serine/threonine-protein kinase